MHEVRSIQDMLSFWQKSHMKEAVQYVQKRWGKTA